MENKRNQKLPEMGTKEFNDLASQYFGGKPKEKSTRELALEWWNSLPYFGSGNKLGRNGLSNKHYQKQSDYLTGREIEEIWKNQLPLEERESYYGMYKPNEQFFNSVNDEDTFDTNFGNKANQKQFKVTKQIAENSTYGADSKNHPINRKQFVEFNPELFDSYCMKFKEKDRLQLAEIAINNCNMFFEDSAKIIEIIRKYR